jgi:hypothetical protein
LLVVKFAENDPMVPDLCRFSITQNDYYDLKDVRKYENHCIKFLDYKLDFFTSYDILTYIINIGLFFNDEIHSDYPVEKVFLYAYKLLNHFVFNNLSLKFNPLQIGISIMCLTRERFKFDEERTDFLLNFYGYKKDYFYECMNVIKLEEISKMNIITPFVREREKSHTTKAMVNMIAVQEKLKNRLEEAESEKSMNLLTKSVSSKGSYLSIYTNLKKIDSAKSGNSSNSSKSNSKEKNLKVCGLVGKLKLSNSKGRVLAISSANHSNASTSSNVSSKSLNKYSSYSNRSKDLSLILPKINVNSKTDSENSLNKSTNFNKLSAFYNHSKFHKNSDDLNIN